MPTASPAAADITVESAGLRLTLRVESSLEDYSRRHEGQLPAFADHEFADLIHRSLPAALPLLLAARDQVAASVHQSYVGLLSRALATLPKQRRGGKRRAR